MGIQFSDTANRQKSRARLVLRSIFPAKGEQIKTSGL